MDHVPDVDLLLVRENGTRRAAVSDRVGGRARPGRIELGQELFTFRETGAYKMFENHLGHALIQNANLQFAAEAEPRATPAEQVEKPSVN